MPLDRDEKDYLFHNRHKDSSDKELLEYYRRQRDRGVPHVYITEKTVFFDVILQINDSCLIPRLESEILVEKSLTKFPHKGRVLDLCTGSGALGLAIKKNRPNLDVTLSDISTKAMEIAKKNAEMNNLNVELKVGDLFSPLVGKRFDAIICNPPYVSEKEYRTLDESVRVFEPKIALVAEDNGLSFYKRLATQAHYYLTDGGVLCLEIGKDQANSVQALFSNDFWTNQKVEKDYSSHDRFFFLKKGVKIL